MNEPTFTAGQIKLELLPKLISKPFELSGWLFSVKYYCEMIGIAKPIDMVNLAASRLEWSSFS